MKILFQWHFWEVHGASKCITIIETIFYRNNNSGMFKTQSQDKKNGFWPLKWSEPDNFSLLHR